MALGCVEEVVQKGNTSLPTQRVNERGWNHVERVMSRASAFQLPPDQFQQRPESQVVRSLYDCPEVPVGSPGAGEVSITLFGVPEVFATFLGLRYT